jgi:dephospho-CoA kinase
MPHDSSLTTSHSPLTTHHSPLKVGLTGGIGSGKSTVAKIFEALGVPVYYADEAARRLMNESEELKEALKALFGERSYVDDQLDRKYVASIVFNEPAKLAQLNSIVHPVTLKDAAEWMLAQNTPYIIKEAALIFEAGAQADLDKVIGVYAPKHLRIHRVMKRDNVSREEVLSRMSRQIQEEIKMKLCDFVIKNDEQDFLMKQVVSLHKHLLSLV